MSGKSMLKFCILVSLTCFSVLKQPSKMPYDILYIFKIIPNKYINKAD